MSVLLALGYSHPVTETHFSYLCEISSLNYEPKSESVVFAGRWAPGSLP